MANVDMILTLSIQNMPWPICKTNMRIATEKFLIRNSGANGGVCVKAATHLSSSEFKTKLDKVLFSFYLARENKTCSIKKPAQTPAYTIPCSFFFFLVGICICVFPFRIRIQNKSAIHTHTHKTSNRISHTNIPQANTYLRTYTCIDRAHIHKTNSTL